MSLNIELYRRTIYTPADSRAHSRRISVIDIQPEDARHTLLFVHGYGGNALQWLYQLRFFGQMARVIAPDQRGHGLSDDPPGHAHTLDSLVDDLEFLIDSLNIKTPLHIIAHCFGGPIAIEFALRHPEKLYDMVLIGVPTQFTMRPFLRNLIKVPDPVFSYAAKKYGVEMSAPQHTLKTILDGMLFTWHGSERMPLITTPTLIILGHRDRVFLRQHLEEVPRHIPGAQQVIIPVSAHLVQLERSDAVNRAISRFFDKNQRGRSEDALDHSRHLESNWRTIHSTNHAEMPWLEQYDNGVPRWIPLPKQILQDMLSNAALTFPQHPAIICGLQKISYRELERFTNQFAHALLAMGIKKGERVAILLPDIPQSVIAFYGALNAGAIVVMGNPRLEESELQRQLDDSGARILFTLESYGEGIRRVCENTRIDQIIQFEETDYTCKRFLRNQPSTPLNSSVTSDDLALIQYTGGITGLPRGVMLTQGNLVANVVQKCHWMPAAKRSNEVIMSLLPLSHAYGITNGMNWAIALAGSLVLVPEKGTAQVLEAIKQHRPTILTGVPTLFQAIANFPNARSYEVSRIRICVSGSAPLPVEVQEAFEKVTRAHLVEAYALTEASPSTHSNPHHGERRVGSIGLPLPSTHARIVSLETGEPLPPREVGELLIQGPQIMQGYWNLPDETARVLRDGWLHTDDLAFMDEDGFFTIVDRKKDALHSSVDSLYVREVEEALYEHPKVLEASVLNTRSSIADSSHVPGDLFIKAVVVLKPGEKATEAELLDYIHERLNKVPQHMLPRQIEFRTELPKNVVGKILRDLLVEE